VPSRWTAEAPGVTVARIFTPGEDMAKNAPAAKATKKAAKKTAAKKVPAKKTAAKKATRKPAAAAKPPAKKVGAKPPRKAPPTRGGPGPVTFTVEVGQGSLTMAYDGSEAQDYEMVLFVRDEEQARRAQECIDAMSLRKLVVAIAKTYTRP
jgi:hypothetical protein